MTGQESKKGSGGASMLVTVPLTSSVTMTYRKKLTSVGLGSDSLRQITSRPGKSVKIRVLASTQVPPTKLE